jgi:hypothetical protein
MNNEAPQYPPTKFIYTVLETMDDVGRRIVHRTVIVGVQPPDFPTFIGVSRVFVRTSKDAPAQESVYQFPIEGVRTLEEAYGRYDDCAQVAAHTHVEDLQRALREQMSSLVVPGREAPPSKLILPGG